VLELVSLLNNGIIFCSSRSIRKSASLATSCGYLILKELTEVTVLIGVLTHVSLVLSPFLFSIEGVKATTIGFRSDRVVLDSASSIGLLIILHAAETSVSHRTGIELR